MWTISLPLRVPVSKRKDFIINLNVYRNAHPMVLNKAKIVFGEIVGPRLKGVPKLDRCTLQYVLYPGTARECDVNNVISIQDKFFCDTMVDCGVLENDNYKFLAKGSWEFGHIDRENPRVEVIIRSPDHIPLVPPEVIHESEDMKIRTLITITKADVATAFREFLSKHITVPENAEIELVELTNGDFEVRLETGAAQVETPEKTTSSRKRKSDRLEPKDAMQALVEQKRAKEESGQVPVEAQAEVETDLWIPEQELPVVGEERGHVDASTPTAPLTTASIFTKAAAAAPVEVQEQPKAEESPPAPPKGPSLFASFTRPKN